MAHHYSALGRVDDMILYRKHPSAVLRSPEYLQHVEAMTREKLESKADIALELAARDIEIRECRKLLFKWNRDYFGFRSPENSATPNATGSGAQLGLY